MSQRVDLRLHRMVATRLGTRGGRGRSSAS